MLLALTALGFVIGVRAESHDTHNQIAEAVDSHSESAEATEGNAEVHQDSGAEHTVLGLDPEAPLLVAFAVVASLALAVGLWRTSRSGVAIAAAVFAAAFAVFDLAELLHQLDDDRAGLALLAAAIALGHLAASLAAGYAAFSPQLEGAPRRTT